MNGVSDSMVNAWDQAITFLTGYGLSAAGGVIILIVGWVLAGWASRGVNATLSHVHGVDITLRRFVASVVRYLIITFTVLAVLSQFGVQTASLIAVFGAAGLAIGLALQGTLANLAAGVMILIFRPFRVGDRVDAGGHGGTVEAIDLFVTELRSPDNVQLLIPNGKIWGSAVTNFSIHKTRRVDLKLVIGEVADLDHTFVAVRETLGGDRRALGEPAPAVTMSEIGEASVTLTAQAWVRAEDHDEVKVALMKSLKQRLGASLKTITA